ncbi:KTSC domain-containing protein [Malonomonas rubra]|uniref:KTSC domain-containing protein n=1 Tax=Malonomonas rubra TaxID=57040 RepID=UPI0026ED9B44|nr:KTSC domain-containing protein [Malonomonas rubra]
MRFFFVATLMFAGVILLQISTVKAREVYINDWGIVEVDAEHFISLQGKMKPSSQINRMYYDVDNQYLLVSLNGTFYHYCKIPQDVIDSWLTSDSLSEYYQKDIKGNFDCKTNPPPDYRR